MKKTGVTNQQSLPEAAPCYASCSDSASVKEFGHSRHFHLPHLILLPLSLHNQLLNANIKANFRNITFKPKYFCWQHRKLPPSITSLTSTALELKNYPEEILHWLSCAPRKGRMQHRLVNAKETQSCSV